MRDPYWSTITPPNGVPFARRFKRIKSAIEDFIAEKRVSREIGSCRPILVFDALIELKMHFAKELVSNTDQPFTAKQIAGANWAFRDMLAA
jgi:hypothetical protein